MGCPRALRRHRRRGGAPHACHAGMSVARPDTAARAAADHAARTSYGRLVAILAARTRDIAQAEDALADAFAAALQAWPRDGVPGNPAAWLLTVARRRTLDDWRHSQVTQDAHDALLAVADELGHDAQAGAVPDERLRLLFVCAHPAIDAAARAPLMLQAVLGLDVARMAGAFMSGARHAGPAAGPGQSAHPRIGHQL
jgi:RNA polymerase sigma-70 factor (ECF subfamily)